MIYNELFSLFTVENIVRPYSPATRVNETPLRVMIDYQSCVLVHFIMFKAHHKHKEHELQINKRK